MSFPGGKENTINSPTNLIIPMRILGSLEIWVSNPEDLLTGHSHLQKKLMARTNIFK